MGNKMEQAEAKREKNRTLEVNHQVGFMRSWISEPSEEEEGRNNKRNNGRREEKDKRRKL